MKADDAPGDSPSVTRASETSPYVPAAPKPSVALPSPAAMDLGTQSHPAQVTAAVSAAI